MGDPGPALSELAVTVEPSFLTLIRKIFDHGDEGEPLLLEHEPLGK
jgi:hypothetical protein